MKNIATQIFAYQWECPHCSKENITPLKEVSCGFGEKCVKCKHCEAEIEIHDVEFDLEMR